MHAYVPIPYGSWRVVYSTSVDLCAKCRIGRSRRSPDPASHASRVVVRAVDLDHNQGALWLDGPAVAGGAERLLAASALSSLRCPSSWWRLGSGFACWGRASPKRTDPTDARSVAIAALRHPGLTIVRADDHARVLGLLARRHRDIARMKNKVACLHALLMELVAGGLASEMTVNKAQSLLEQVEISDEMTRQRVAIATELVEDIARLDSQMRASKKRIRTALPPRARRRVTSGGSDRSERPSSRGRSATSPGSPPRGHFASYNATAPIEASPGDKRRHRLNPRGNRKLNHALHIGAVSQLRYPGEGRDYYQKKIAEGKASKEAIRALKRRISNVVYRRLLADARRCLS